jgi:hypothetical protein
MGTLKKILAVFKPNPKKNIAKNCIDCKYFEQGKDCSFCGHPKQPNEDFKKYLYYNFSCILHEQGIAQSRINYMIKMKKNGNNKKTI